MADPTTHNGGLSPAGGKIVKECIVEVPTAGIKDNHIFFVTRPPSSGMQDTGFQFARPTLPGRAFSSHPQPRCSQAVGREGTFSSQSQYNKEALAPDTTPQSGKVVTEDFGHADNGKARASERARTASPSLESGTPTSSAFSISSQNIPPSILSKNRKENISINTLQTTEDELFKLLIQKLKKREVAEAAAAKLRDELKANLRDAGEDNKLLTVRLKNLEYKYEEQQMEKTAQRQSIERWKVKFGKVRGLMVGIADHQERLLKEYRSIRKEQVSLNIEKDQINDSLNYLTESTKGLGKNISQYKAQLTGVIHQFTAEENALEALVKSKESQNKDMERLLEEKNQAIEDAQALACKIDSEKLTLELNSREAEKRIREELSRASLISKDQDRARFEQEKHTLTREKQQAEADNAKLGEELETMKAELVGNYQKKLDGAEKECETIKLAHEKAILALKQHQASQVGEKHNIQKQLEAIQEANIALKQENSALKLTNIANLGEHVTLKQENSALQQINVVNHKENASLQQENTDIKTQVTALKQENANIKAEKSILQKENARIKANKAVTETEKAALQEENTILKQANAEIKANNVTIIAENTALKERNDKLTADKLDCAAGTNTQSINILNDSDDGPIKKEKGDSSLKGILKETQSTTAPSIERPAQFHTPSKDTKKKRLRDVNAAPRRQSRVSSRFFDPQPTPSPSLSVITSQQGLTWAVNHSVDTFVTQSSVHSRKRRRGKIE
ncbi:hypothetical protein McanMca71_005508 [Microsporum canis]